MNAQQLENREIWKGVKGADKLFEIYQYFPTLHDAKIRSFEINLEGREFYLTVDYCDFIKEPGDEVATRFMIRWGNVQMANFDWRGEDLYGMKFSKAGDFIKMKFEFGFNGDLISREIEITNVEIEPENDENSRGVIKFSIN
jgi:hypothetical protein